jgi:hypothetical protein
MAKIQKNLMRPIEVIPLTILILKLFEKKILRFEKEKIFQRTEKILKNKSQSFKGSLKKLVKKNKSGGTEQKDDIQNMMIIKRKQLLLRI